MSSPTVASDDLADLCLRHTESGGKNPLSGFLVWAVPQVSDFSDLVLRQFRAGGAVAPLGEHVGRVVGRAADEQVPRVDAWRVVALVADQLPCGDFADVQLVAVAGCSAGDGVASGRDAAVPEHAVTIKVAGPRPEPAVIRPASVHLLPEAMFGRNRRSSHSRIVLSRYDNKGTC